MVGLLFVLKEELHWKHTDGWRDIREDDPIEIIDEVGSGTE